jgi:hypothetical protein
LNGVKMLPFSFDDASLSLVVSSVLKLIHHSIHSN